MRRLALKLPGYVVAVADVAAGYKHCVRAQAEGLHDEGRVNTARAHHTDDTDVGRILDTGGARQVGARIGTPVAQYAEDLGFEFVSHFKHHPPVVNSAAICALICSFLKCCMVIALAGQAAPQVPQPLHMASFTLAFLWPSPMSSRVMALYGHRLPQTPQPEHNVSLTLAAMGSSETLPWLIGIWAAAAAPAAWATVSGMSFGPWQQPARKMPSVLSRTGSAWGEPRAGTCPGFC